MKKLFVFPVLAALAAVVSGCTPTVAGPPDITGMIYSIEAESFLVVEGIDSADIPYEEWFEDGRNAIVFTVTGDTVLQKGKEVISFEQLDAGQTVEVWSTGVLLDSYPQQGTAKKVVVLEQD
jgi:hypothetical protein